MIVLEPRGEAWGSIAALGDIGLVGSARARIAREGWDAPFEAVAPQLRLADLGFANLEFPVGAASSVRPGRSSEFHHDPEVAAALVRAGVHVVSLANNHLMDCGPEGLAATLESCRCAGLGTVGAGATLAEARRPWIREVRGRRLVLLAYGAAAGDAAGPENPGIAPLDAALVAEDLDRWRREADLLVVSAHWGSMYVDYPPPRVLEWAGVLERAGVDLVLGHHPHVLQGAERRGRTLVAYSLGDAIFNAHAGDLQPEVAAAKRLESAVFTARFASEAHGLELLPTRLDADGIPREPRGEELAAALARWKAMSEGLSDGERAFAEQSASTLLQYEVQSLTTYLRQGRWDRVLRLLGSVRPRHLPVLWHAITRKARRR